MKQGAIAALTVEGDAPSPCAKCGRLVMGHQGDVKVVVEHVQAVFCSDCFDRHPRREDWTCPRSGRGTAARALPR